MKNLTKITVAIFLTLICVFAFFIFKDYLNVKAKEDSMLNAEGAVSSVVNLPSNSNVTSNTSNTDISSNTRINPNTNNSNSSNVNSNTDSNSSSQSNYPVVDLNSTSTTTKTTAPNLNFNSIVAKASPSNPISKENLISLMKYWISTEQYNCSGIASCYGTFFSAPWLNAVSSLDFYNAFIDANGIDACSKDITAKELVTATEQLVKILSKKPVPFTLPEATNLIKEMLHNSYPNETIIKITQPSPECYYVYTSPYNTNTKNTYPFWVVDGYTGYAHG